MKRRKLMRGGLTLAAGAIGSWGFPALAAENPAPGLARRLAGLASDLTGTVVTEADSTYARLSQPWNAGFANVRPLAVVVAADGNDVARAIGFAREERLDFALRSGGHSFEGFSATDGIVIDVRSLNDVTADVAAETATVGAGMTDLPLYRALWPHRMTVPAGTCPTVGLAGLTLGGGFGRLSPLYGLTSDNVLSLRIVTADGQLVTASEQENSDLFWACRGGGGGNFGAVTDFTFRLRPVDMSFSELSYTFAWDSALPVLRAWQTWVTELPREGHCELELITGAPTPESGPTVKIDFTFAGPEARARTLAAELLGASGATPIHSNTTTEPFISLQRGWLCAALSPAECETEGLSPDGRLTRQGIFIGSDLVFEPWPDEGLGLLIDAIERRQRDRTLTPENFNPDTDVGKVLMEACGGAINDTAPDATAFPHRGMIYMAQYQSRWAPGSDQQVVEANKAWTREMFESVAPYRSGASYSNYGTLDPGDWQRACYGGNLPRLRQIKARYDPDNVFRFAQSIIPA